MLEREKGGPLLPLRTILSTSAPLVITLLGQTRPGFPQLLNSKLSAPTECKCHHDSSHGLHVLRLSTKVIPVSGLAARPRTHFPRVVIPVISAVLARSIQTGYRHVRSLFLQSFLPDKIGRK